MAETEQHEGAAAEESGWVRGRDPRDMSQAELLAMGHEPMSPTRPVTTAIIVHQRPDEPTRTPNKSCRRIAEAVVGGRVFTALSRYGAPSEFARVLVAAGIANAPMQVHSAGCAARLTRRQAERRRNLRQQPGGQKAIALGSQVLTVGLVILRRHCAKHLVLQHDDLNAAAA
jgi:hypothetical protein